MRRSEFYADQVVYNLKRTTEPIAGLTVAATALIVLLISLNKLFGFKQVDHTVAGLEQFVSESFPAVEESLLLAAPPWFAILLFLVPGIINLVRKYWLYPGKSLGHIAFTTIQSRHAATGQNWYKTHYVVVGHPVDQRPIVVAVDKQSYSRIREGDEVLVRYHATERNILCMEVVFAE